MILQRRRRRSPEVNLTPLIDVVFLLLIFFMVSTTFEREAQIKVELPEASTEPDTEAPPEILDIVIDRGGRFFVNQKEVINTDIDTLKLAIERAIDGKTDLPVLISADANTPYQSVITAMDAASQLGLMQMTFAAQQPRSSE